ncbi:MAG: ribonuclease HIII [Candidatus Zixiibacteriota bacterium]|nr:MAG: ribonuclease HIII [candidate division Zixibacteria bacterium]
MPSRLVVGVDESGKGDFFGPLVIAAFLASDSDCGQLEKAGVRDGKKISNNRVLDLDEYLRANFVHQVVIIDPEEYNARYKVIRNLNKLLANGHAEAITGILERQKVDLVIVDQFGKPELIETAMGTSGFTVDIHQRFRGEQIIQVAAASILARAAFIREIAQLSREYHLEIPKGAAAKVDQAGRELVRLYGIEVLPKVAKTHFKNYGRVTAPTLFS